MAKETIFHYRIVKKLGHGGMAEVYEAVDKNTEKSVALKVLLPHLVTDTVVKERFLREAKVGMELDHPGIVKVYEVGEDSQPFIAMELVKGRTLDRFIEKEPLDLEETISIGQQLADALIAAHKQGIIHRDLKPRNIMIKDNQAKIMDFGLARVVDTSSLTEKHEVIGTLYYMSPEQAIGESIDGRSDIFSLGVMLYQMLTGRRPFDGEHPGTIIHAILYSEPLRFADIGRKLPKEAEQVVFKALQKQVDKRYQSAIDLDTDLRNLRKALDGNPVTLIASDVSLEEVFEKHRGIYSALVGREKELQNLQKHLTHMLQGKQSAILISGEAGIGKSRLIWELGQQAKKQDVRYLVGRCVVRGGTPYQPIFEVIGHYFDIKGITTERDLDQYITEYAEHLSYRKGIVATLALKQSAKEVNIINKEQLWDTAAEVIKAMSRDRPILFHLDDLHWADAPTLDMLTYILRSTTDERVLIIGTYRPEDITEKGNPLRAMLKKPKKEKLFKELPIQRLSKEGTENIIKSVFENSMFKDDFTESVHNETEGNPLFVLEVLKLLRDENIITRHNTGWHLAQDTIKMKIPRTVTDVITRRLERLNEDERELVDIASVEGLAFQSDTIAHCLEQPRIRILRRLQNLELSHNLIHASTDGYHFDHGKIKDVVYDSLIPEIKKEYHKIMGEYFRENFSDKDAYAGRIAVHLHTSGQDKEALPFYQKAGEYAQKVFANEEAIRYFKQGVAIIDMIRDQHQTTTFQKPKLAMLRKIGEVMILVGEYDSAVQVYQSIAMLARDWGDQESYAIGLSGAGKAFIGKGDHESAMKFQKQALEIYRQLGNRRGEATTLNSIGYIYRIHFDFTEALRCCKEALRIRRQIGDKRGESITLNAMGFIETGFCNFGKALKYSKESLRISRKINDKLTEMLNLKDIAFIHFYNLNSKKALRHFDQSLSMCIAVGNKSLQAYDLNGKAEVMRQLGNCEYSLVYSKQALDIFRKIGEERGECWVLFNRGWYHLIRGDHKRALNSAAEALNIAKKLGEKEAEGWALELLGKIHLILGDVNIAMKYLRQVCEFWELMDYRRGEAYSFTILGSIYQVRGNFEKALECYSRSLEILEGTGLGNVQIYELHNLCIFWLEIGNLRKAMEILKAQDRKANKIGLRKYSAVLCIDKAMMKHFLGLHEEACIEVQKGLKMSKKIGDISIITNALLASARIELARKSHLRASEYAKEVFDLAKDRKIDVARAHLILAHTLLFSGDLDGAASQAIESRNIAQTRSLKPLLWQAHHVLGKVHAKQKEHAKAKKEFTKAEKVVDKIVSKLSDELKKTYLKKKEIRELKKDIEKLENRMKKGRKNG